MQYVTSLVFYEIESRNYRETHAVGLILAIYRYRNPLGEGEQTLKSRAFKREKERTKEGEREGEGAGEREREKDDEEGSGTKFVKRKWKRGTL